MTFGCAEIDAFLERFEQLGEAQLLFTLLGYIAPEDAYTDDFIPLDDPIQHSLEVQRPRTALQPDAYRPSPTLPFQKASEATLHLFAAGFFEQVIDVTADELRILKSGQFAHAAVDSTQRAVERNCAGRVVHGIDQFLEIALGAQDDLAQLIELLFGRSGTNVFLQAAQQSLQFVDLSTASIGVNRKENRQNQNANRNRPQLKRDILEALPHECCQRRGQQNHEHERPAPELRFFLIEVAGLSGRSRRGVDI